MSIEGQGHFFTIYFPGFVCFVPIRAKISGERLQDHWSSGSLTSQIWQRKIARLNVPLCEKKNIANINCRENVHEDNYLKINNTKIKQLVYKASEGIESSVDPDQTAPSRSSLNWAYTVSSGLYV